MRPILRVVSAGPGVSLQDAGRRLHLRFGVTAAGPMDAAAFAAATRMAQTEAAQTEAAIEVSLGGAVFEAESGAIGLAVAGGDFDLALDGEPLAAACALTLPQGSRLSIRPGRWGAWCYVAPFARFDVAPMLGSVATHAYSALGGLDGRSLAAGDALPLADPRPSPPRALRMIAPMLERSHAPIRALLGPQDDYFTPQALHDLFAARWRLSPRSDRMAYRLEGPRLTHCKGHDIVSDGVAFGAIQAPGDGVPLVLMADRQPTGGYPKIATVIGADLGRLAQTRPGETVTFARVSHEEAVAARRALQAMIAAGPRLEPLKQAPSVDTLMRENLVGGVVDATSVEACGAISGRKP